MKSKKSILLGIIIFIIVIFLAGCGLNNLIDNKEFKSHFEELGYTISNGDIEDSELKSYLIASKEDIPYKIEYYEYDTELNAKKSYEKYKKSIANYITSTSKNQETNGTSYTKLIAISDNEYIVISRVKNTLIFVNGTNEYSNEIDNLLKEIKY